MRTKSPDIPFCLNVKSHQKPLKSNDDNENVTKNQQQEIANVWPRKRKRSNGLESALNIADSIAEDVDSGTGGKLQDKPAKVSDSRIEMDVDDVDFFDRVVCVICNKCEGESLLACCVTSCPISLHAKCLPLSPKFDDGRNYYCPYCWYKREYDKARELKQKVMLRKKELLEFMAGKVVGNDKEKGDFSQRDRPERQGDGDYQCGVGGENGMNTVPPVGDGDACCRDRVDNIPSVGPDSYVNGQKSSKSSAVEGNKKKLSADEDIDEQVDGGNIRMTEDDAETETDDRSQQEQMNEEVPEYPVSYVGVAKPKNSVVSDLDSSDNEILALRQTWIAKQKKPNRGVAEPKPKSSVVSDLDSSDNEILALRQKRIAKQKKLNRGVAELKSSVMSDWNGLDDEILTLRQKRIAKQKKLNKVAMPQNSRPSEILSPENNNTRNQVSDGKNKKASSAKTSKRSQESAKGMKLVFQNERRKPLKWSVEEEDKLMELVAKFSGDGERRIPWSRILQEGEGVFHNSRRPDDIKEKWRVMERNDEVILAGSR